MKKEKVLAPRKKETLKITGHKRLAFNPPSAKKDEYFWVIASVDARKKGRAHRAWSIWSSKKQAIEHGVFGWDDAEFFYESGYYTHIVVEKMRMNHPLPITIGKGSQKWFRLVATKDKTKGFGESVKAVPCKRPKQFEHVVGFM
jgi:hypothetical protein